MAKGGGNSAARKSAKKSEKRGNARTADMFENGLDVLSAAAPSAAAASQKAKPRAKPRRWNAGEDTVLKRVVKEEGEKNWNGIAKRVSALTGIVRSDVQCQHRYAHCLKDGLVKGHWKNHEDRTILSTVLELGIQNVRWSSIAKDLPGRIGKQVRDRYINYLDPKLKKEPFTPEEDARLKELQGIYGNKWACLASLMEGRSENVIKNRWHKLTTSKKRKAAKSQPKGPKRLRGHRIKTGLSGCNIAVELRRVSEAVDIIVRVAEAYRIIAKTRGDGATTDAQRCERVRRVMGIGASAQSSSTATRTLISTFSTDASSSSIAFVQALIGDTPMPPDDLIAALDAVAAKASQLASPALGITAVVASPNAHAVFKDDAPALSAMHNGVARLLAETTTPPKDAEEKASGQVHEI